MGDAGSNFLGFLLGTLTVVGTFTRPSEGFSPYGVLTPLLVMAVPLYDTTSVILIRIVEGRSPFEADRRHFSHRLVDRGLTPPLAVRTIYLVTLAGGLGALLLPRLSRAGERMRGRRPDGLPARGGGPPRSLHEPPGASRWRGETPESRQPLRLAPPPQTPTRRPEPDHTSSPTPTTRSRRSANSSGKQPLGLAAMLFVVRAYFPSEDADSGSGLVWVFAMLATSALADRFRCYSAGRSGSAGRGPTRRSWP